MRMLKKDNICALWGIILLGLVACKDKEKPAIDLSSSNNQIKDSAINLVLKKFSLPYLDNLKLDSNSLIFYGDRSFDTSFLIHLEKRDGEIDGTYYEVLPDYHRNLYDVRTPSNQILYFEGYGFKLDLTKWGTVKNKVKELLSVDTSNRVNRGCCDGGEYGLYYDGSKKIKGNLDDQTQYESFYRFLKGLFLEGFIQNRKPVMYKKK